MARVITDYLDLSARYYSNKKAFIYDEKSITFGKLREDAIHIAAGIIQTKTFKKPIALYLEKGIECVVSFLGTAYSGNFYTMIDTSMPSVRIEKIMDTLKPEIILTDRDHFDEVNLFVKNVKILVYEDLLVIDAKEEEVLAVTRKVKIGRAHV